MTLSPDSDLLVEAVKEPARACRWKNYFFVMYDGLCDEETGKDHTPGQYEDFRTHATKLEAEAFAAEVLSRKPDEAVRKLIYLGAFPVGERPNV